MGRNAQRLTSIQTQALRYLDSSGELRQHRVPFVMYFLGDGGFRVPTVTIERLRQLGLASVARSPEVKRARITDRGRKLVRGLTSGGER